MSKQTAVEWMLWQLSKVGYLPDGVPEEIHKQAKAMEREQKKQDIHNYFEWHKSKGYVSHQPIDIKEYFEQTYGKEAGNGKR